MEAEVGEVRRTEPVATTSSGGLDGFFKLTERGTSVGAEVRAGVTTFLVMAYIIFLNPLILSNMFPADSAERAAFIPAASAATALLAGVLIFVVPAGPWMSQESMVNVMGRGMGTQAVLAFFGHFARVFLYSWIIALCIYRLPLGAGVGFGALLALPLWAVNYAVFAVGAGFQANEVHAAIAHFMFCLFFSVAYRGMAVPRPLRKDGGEARSGGATQAPAGGLGT